MSASHISLCADSSLQLWERLPQVSRETAMARVQCSCTLAVNASEGDVLVVCLSAVIEKQRPCVFCNVRLPYPLSKNLMPHSPPHNLKWLQWLPKPASHVIPYGRRCPPCNTIQHCSSTRQRSCSSQFPKLHDRP